MRFARRHSDSSPGWVQSALFNAVLLLLPLMAANVVSGIFSARDFPASPRAGALEATRIEIISRFERLGPRGDSARAHWAQLVDTQLRRRQMSAARGFLLAAPQMLDERDREAVLQAAPQAVPFGTEDEQLIGAALLFLPNDVRVRYETATQPAEIPAIASQADAGNPSAADTAQADTTEPAEMRPVAASSPTSDSSFSLLGTMADLARSARDWAGRPEADGFLVRMTGLGLIAEETDRTRGLGLDRAASLLRTAERAGRLEPDFRRRLVGELDSALPAATLRARLSEGFSSMLTTEQQAELLRQALTSTLRADGLAPLLGDLAQINEIVDAVGPVAALALIEDVRTENDLRKMRLIAESGGDRAIALESLIGRDILLTARTGIELTREDVLEIMGLAATAMALFWLLLSNMRRYMLSPIRPFSYE